MFKILSIITSVLLSVVVATAAPPEKPVKPRNADAIYTKKANDTTRPDISISDEDLKQAALWIEKSKTQKKTESAEVLPIKESDETKPGVATSSETTTAPTTALATETLPTTEKDFKITKNADLYDQKSEDQIPVLNSLDTNKKLKKDSPLARIALSLGVIVGMILGVYLFLKKWSKVQGSRNKNTQIKVLTQHFLGPKKSLAIIRVAGESILIGITDHSITNIKSLSLMDEEIPTETSQSFGKSLAEAEQVQDVVEPDEFSVTKIIGNKLKGMKEI